MRESEMHALISLNCTAFHNNRYSVQKERARAHRGMQPATDTHSSCLCVLFSGPSCGEEGHVHTEACSHSNRHSL